MFTTGLDDTDPSAQEVVLKPRQRITGIRLLVADAEPTGAASVAGRVVDGAGKPVPGARVMFAGGVSPAAGVAPAYADVEGRFELRGLAGSGQPCTLQVTAAGHATSTREDVPVGVMNVTLVLERTGAIEGRVVDARTGQPIPRFQVSDAGVGVSSRGVDVMRPRVETYFYDSEGRFALSDLRPGDHTLVARAPGYAPAAQAVPGVQSDATVSGVTISLLRGCRVEGRVEDPTGRPVARADVELTDAPDRAQRGTLRQNSDRDGRFTFEGLPAQTAHLRVDHPQYGRAVASTRLAPGQIASVVLVLGSGASIEGLVTVNGAPASGAEIDVSGDALEPDMDRPPLTADPAGYYALRGLREGSCQVHVRLQGGSATMYREVQVAANQTTRMDFDFDLGTGVVEGYLTLRGKPVAGNVAAVLALGEDRQQRLSTPADTNGWYRLEAVPGGRVALDVSALGMGDVQRSVEVNVQENGTLRQDIELVTSGAIEGRVHGGPRPGSAGPMVQVLLAPGSLNSDQVAAAFGPGGSGLPGLRQAPVGQNGAYGFYNLEPGAYTVVALGFNAQATTPDLDAAVVTLLGAETLTADLSLE